MFKMLFLQAGVYSVVEACETLAVT
jgi:hypothetical protein